MNGLWPLRPMPRECEPLASWVRRIAEDYAVDYNTFCRKVLLMRGRQLSRLNFEIPNLALAILSQGTGVEKDRIEAMTIPRIMKDIGKIVRQYRRSDPVSGKELRQKMLEDSFAIAPQRRKREPKPKTRKPSIDVRRSRGSAWVWTYMEDDEQTNS